MKIVKSIANYEPVSISTTHSSTFDISAVFQEKFYCCIHHTIGSMSKIDHIHPIFQPRALPAQISQRQTVNTWI